MGTIDQGLCDQVSSSRPLTADKSRTANYYTDSSRGWTSHDEARSVVARSDGEIDDFTLHHLAEWAASRVEQGDAWRRSVGHA